MHGLPICQCWYSLSSCVLEILQVGKVARWACVMPLCSVHVCSRHLTSMDTLRIDTQHMTFLSLQMFSNCIASLCI